MQKVTIYLESGSSIELYCREFKGEKIGNTIDRLEMEYQSKDSTQISFIRLKDISAITCTPCDDDAESLQKSVARNALKRLAGQRVTSNQDVEVSVNLGVKEAMNK